MGLAVQEGEVKKKKIPLVPRRWKDSNVNLKS